MRVVAILVSAILFYLIPDAVLETIFLMLFLILLNKVVCMDIIYAFKAIFYNLTLCMSYTFDFGSYTFSLGSVIVGSMILSCSSAFIIYLLKR